VQYIQGTVVCGVKWWLLGTVYTGNCCVWCEVVVVRCSI